jgi:hypothetical protein
MPLALRRCPALYSSFVVPGKDAMSKRHAQFIRSDGTWNTRSENAFLSEWIVGSYREVPTIDAAAADVASRCAVPGQPRNVSAQE